MPVHRLCNTAPQVFNSIAGNHLEMAREDGASRGAGERGASDPGGGERVPRDGRRTGDRRVTWDRLSAGDRHTVEDKRPGGSDGKQQKETKGDDPSQHIAKIPVRRDDQGGYKRHGELIEFLRDWRHKKERTARPDKLPLPKSSKKGLRIEDSPHPELDRTMREKRGKNPVVYERVSSTESSSDDRRRRRRSVVVDTELDAVQLSDSSSSSFSSDGTGKDILATQDTIEQAIALGAPKATASSDVAPVPIDDVPSVVPAANAPVRSSLVMPAADATSALGSSTQKHQEETSGNASDTARQMNKLMEKTSRYLAEFGTGSRYLQLNSVSSATDELPTLELPKSMPTEHRNARMVEEDLFSIQDCLMEKPLNKEGTIEYIGAATVAWENSYELGRPADLEKLMSYFGALVQRLKGELPVTFEGRTLAAHEGEARSSLAKLESACSDVLPDLDLLKSGREDVAADLQKSKQAGATWKKEAEEHELKAKDAREKEHQCLESEEAAAKNLQVYDSTINGVMQLVKRRDEAKVYLGHLAEEKKHLAVAVPLEVAAILSYRRESAPRGSTSKN
ncbi:uncharacterized protein LOC127770262 [Oryza glaberrima]|uniref:uncharacterized protein LOC127770262 n=1 Tax=Oryza glaberrima TaxID=4538 RepID=UPI00224BFFCD|nr:uncharacterized protein LOC127770262 [Oryza glaberrima]